MLIWFKKWHEVGKAFTLVVAFISPAKAACIELPLSHEEKPFLKCSQPLSLDLKEEVSGVSISVTQNIKSIVAAVNSGLHFIKNRPIKALLLGLATIPTASAFSVINLNQTVNYSYDIEGTMSGLLPIIISNVSSFNTFNLVISHNTVSAGNLTTKGKSTLTPSYAGGIWNVSGQMREVNALASQLFFSNDFYTRSPIYFISQLTDITTGKTLSGKINLYPCLISATNLPQTINYVRNGGSVVLNRISIADADKSTVSVRFFILKEAGDLLFPTTGVNISMSNDSSLGIYSFTYSIPTSLLLQVNPLLARLQFKPAPDYSSDISIGVYISDAYNDLYNVITLTTSKGVPTSTTTPPLTTMGISLSAANLPLTPLTNTITNTKSVIIAKTKPFEESNVMGLTTNSSTLGNFTMPFIINSGDTQLSAIIGGAVPVGLIAIGSIIIGVVVIMRKQSSSAQHQTHDIETQSPHSSTPSYDIIPQTPKAVLPNEAPHSPYQAFADIPNRFPSTPYISVDALS